ncbi:transcriptional regulator [Bacillus sp. AFS001701]|uniref:helix-turn-helix transcriptional regulator n=1 Tax=Bacillus sp. AFS001701 TaxID=2033480 RepID=UPI000BF8C1B8|nr:helix-turn-helix transcriptional regulator [Bacillus sp. AFS001701]PET77607.1 transcriptional regulator [Bacillus sp. AFS001701]
MKSLRGDRTQQQVADDLNIASTTYNMIENGNRFPRKDLQLKLSKYFGVTIEELFFSEQVHDE